MSIKIAAVTDDGQTISQHFGRASYYAVLTIEDGKIVAREQREKPAHRHMAGHHHAEQGAQGAVPLQHGFSPEEQDNHTNMMSPIRDCQVLLARGMGGGAYYSLEQLGIRPILTTVAGIDEAALQAAAGTLEDHREKLH